MQKPEGLVLRYIMLHQLGVLYWATGINFVPTLPGGQYLTCFHLKNIKKELNFRVFPYTVFLWPWCKVWSDSEDLQFPSRMHLIDGQICDYFALNYFLIILYLLHSLNIFSESITWALLQWKVECLQVPILYVDNHSRPSKNIEK